MTEVMLNASMRSNLLSLQQTQNLQDRTQLRLSTGLKVNSAIDNPSSYYTAISLNNRASDLSALLDTMSQGIQTIRATNEAIETGLAFLEQMSSIVEQAISQGGDGAVSVEGVGGTEAAGVESVGGTEAVGNKPQAVIGTDSRALYNGRGDTQAIIDKTTGIGSAGLAATAANQFYVTEIGADNEYFGQGKWYLPAIGDWSYLLYGTDVEVVKGEFGDYLTTINGEYGANLRTINKTLGQLGYDAEQLNGEAYASSSVDHGYFWVLDMNNDAENRIDKYYGCNVRVFQHLENVFNSSSGGTPPQIGDVMYDDLSYGSASGYEAAKAAGKKAVGVIAWISEDGRDAKIINLKDLTFNSFDLEGNFDAEHPYEGSTIYTRWATIAKCDEDITGIENISYSTFLTQVKEPYIGNDVSIDDVPSANGAETPLDAAYSKQFNMVLNNYNKLIADASYKGVNLLQSNDLKINFNEDRSFSVVVKGVDASSKGLGIRNLEWSSQTDVFNSVKELENAINQLRSFSTEFGNYYAIVTTREDFTKNLINVLTEGADKLTLADMNEESANMLALQTRQQLAVNSLSLASSAAQSVLRLF